MEFSPLSGPMWRTWWFWSSTTVAVCPVDWISWKYCPVRPLRCLLVFPRAVVRVRYRSFLWRIPKLAQRFSMAVFCRNIFWRRIYKVCVNNLLLLIAHFSWRASNFHPSFWEHSFAAFSSRSFFEASPRVPQYSFSRNIIPCFPHRDVLSFPSYKKWYGVFTLCPATLSVLEQRAWCIPVLAAKSSRVASNASLGFCFRGGRSSEATSVDALYHGASIYGKGAVVALQQRDRVHPFVHPVFFRLSVLDGPSRISSQI